MSIGYIPCKRESFDVIFFVALGLAIESFDRFLNTATADFFALASL
jgi:hypothetical protein|tara:strand:+ start:22847 stop:22984 length:138 start_codon:yes stop_codon:yes gene_type:complete